MKAFLILAALGFSYYTEYANHLPPCTLCLIQRSLYGLTFIAALLGAATSYKTIAKWSVVTLLSLNFAIASYHTLVQYKIVEDRCKSETIQDMNAYKTMLTAKRPGCSDASWKIGPIPAPILSGLFSLALVIYELRFLSRSAIKRSN